MNAANQVNPVAVWQNSPADLTPAVIYVLGDAFLRRRKHLAHRPRNAAGGSRRPDESDRQREHVDRDGHFSPKFFLEVYVAQDGNSAGTGTMLYRGDCTQFPFGDLTSSWKPLPLPHVDAIKRMLSLGLDGTA